MTEEKKGKDNRDRYMHPLLGEPDCCGQIWCSICQAMVTPKSDEWFEEV